MKKGIHIFRKGFAELKSERLNAKKRLGMRNYGMNEHQN